MFGKRKLKDEITYEMMKHAGWIMYTNGLLNEKNEPEVIKDLFYPESFVRSVYQYCNEKYSPLGERKLRGEYIITTYYGTICAVLFYYSDPDNIDRQDMFGYLKKHIDVEFTDENAERMLGTKAGEELAEKIWGVIDPFVGYSVKLFADLVERAEKNELKEKHVEEIIYETMIQTFIIGMLAAMRFRNEVKNKTHTLGSRKEIDLALKRLAESKKDCREPPEESAMCYSPRASSSNEIIVPYACSECGRSWALLVFDGSEDLIDRYRRLAEEFSTLGHKADVMCLCDRCSQKYSRRGYLNNFIVFAFTAKGSSTPVYSFPSCMSFQDRDYRLALAFLKGADTFDKLSQAAGSNLDPDKYLDIIRSIIGSEAK